MLRAAGFDEGDERELVGIRQVAFAIFLLTFRRISVLLLVVLWPPASRQG